MLYGRRRVERGRARICVGRVAGSGTGVAVGRQNLRVSSTGSFVAVVMHATGAGHG